MGTVSRGHAIATLAALCALCLVAVPELGSGAVPFRPPNVTPHGLLGPLVRAAHGAFDVGVLRSPAALAGLAAGLAGLVVVVRRRPVPALVLLIASGLVVGALLVPGVALQAGLRDATAPWFYDNDSTYQIEIAGDLLRDGTNPYGHDYGASGLERIYVGDGSSPTVRPVALDHFPYFPGMPVAAAVWHALPAPLNDFRFLVLLASLALLPAALLLPGPLALRVAAGAVLAANPLVVRGAWSGTADALPLLALVLAFALLHRRRFTAAVVLLVVGALFKQFLLVGAPFLAVAIAREAGRAALIRASLAGGALLAASLVPFLLWDAGAFVDDAITFGASTYRVIGYGLAGLLVRMHVVSRTGSYPFLPIALVTFVPVTVALLVTQWRDRATWLPAGGFALSMLVLIEIARVFQTSYLVYPLGAAAVAAVLAVGTREGRSAVGSLG